jgi:protein-S-isoprenylcysteine O-methyltransferase Ste14
MAPLILRFAVPVWIALEIALAIYNRTGRRTGSIRDRGSKALIAIAIAAGLWLAFRLRNVPATRMESLHTWTVIVSSLFFLVGLIIRVHAVTTLGRLFTTTVSIQPHHRIVRSGLYAHVRHPAYLGSLLLCAAVGLSFENWASALVLLVLVVPAFLNRIRIEEMALAEAFGEEYAEYSRATKRLIPGVY